MVTSYVLLASTKPVVAKEHPLVARKRIGIFPGTFDPVHAGHLTFALQAISEARLDAVYFLPERQPRSKPTVEHFGHRTAMLTRAIRPHKKLGILELPDSYFDVQRTLPKLQKEFADNYLFFLMGSDTVLKMNSQDWSDEDLVNLMGKIGLVIGLRAGHQQALITQTLRELPMPPRVIRILDVPAKNISSSTIREACRMNKSVDGLLASVKRYARHNWLYVSLSTE